MEPSDLSKQIELIIRSKFRYHLCSITYSTTYEVGTGNLLIHDGQLFVLTCSHVAVEAYNDNNLEICFENDSILKQSQISLFQKSEEDDVSLLRIEVDFKLGELIPLTLENFTFSNDLSSVADQYSNFVVVGFPAEIANIDNGVNMIRLAPLFYLTVLLPGKQQTEENIYLDYPFGKDGESKLPKAGGLSGAGIWKVPPMIDENKIWSPTDWKVVAIQSAWKQGEYIIGKRVKKIFDWLT